MAKNASASTTTTAPAPAPAAADQAGQAAGGVDQATSQAGAAGVAGEAIAGAGEAGSAIGAGDLADQAGGDRKAFNAIDANWQDFDQRSRSDAMTAIAMIVADYGGALVVDVLAELYPGELVNIGAELLKRGQDVIGSARTDPTETQAFPASTYPLTRRATLAELQAAGVCGGWDADRVEAALRRVMG